MRISDWSSDVCSSDLPRDEHVEDRADAREHEHRAERELDRLGDRGDGGEHFHDVAHDASKRAGCNPARIAGVSIMIDYLTDPDRGVVELTVDGPLTKEDYDRIVAEIDDAIGRLDWKRTRLNSSHKCASRMQSHG